MREPSRKLRLLCTSVLVLALLSAGAAMGAPPVREVKVGTDCWQTQDGTEQTLATIPANTLCPGSPAMHKAKIEFKGKPLDLKVVKERCACPEKDIDTKITWTDRHGNKITDPNRMIHAVTQHVDESTKVDTCVRRTTTAKFTKKNEIVSVSLQLIALSLESKNTIKVTCKEKDGSKKEREFTAFVTQSAKQPGGSKMTFTPKSLEAKEAHGDLKLKSLNISYDVEFRPKDGGTSAWIKNRPLKLEDTAGTFTALFP